MIDMAKLRREVIRWILLVSLNSARASGGASETLLLYMIQAEYPDATPLEIRGQLEYLADRSLIKLSGRMETGLPPSTIAASMWSSIPWTAIQALPARRRFGRSPDMPKRSSILLCLKP